MKGKTTIIWVLRVAVFGEFLGHGILALQHKASFNELLVNVLGVSGATADSLLTVIGVSDLTVAALMLFMPIRLVLLWAVFWGFLTALGRPLASEPIWDFVERWPNWGAPLALLLVRGWPRNVRELWR